MTPLEDILLKLNNVKKQNGYFMASCPSHDDKVRSLQITEKDDKVLIKCHAGCETSSILAAISSKFKDLFPDNSQNLDQPIAIYDYTNDNGKLLYQVCRYIDKKFIHRSPIGSGGWVYKMDGVKRVPYNLTVVLEAIKGEKIICITEGEKDANNLISLGLIATTNSGGVGGGKQWQEVLAVYFKGAKVAILPDNDPAGKEHAQTVAKSLQGKAASIKIINLLGLKEKQDVTDWLQAGHSKDELIKLVAETKEWQPSKNKPEPKSLDDWPDPVAKEAFYGLTGDIIKTIEPHTEADPMALLSQFLVAFGNVIDSNPHFKAEEDKHGTNFFICLVGKTAKGRKGTSWGYIKRLFEAADNIWTAKCIVSGLSSGEGLIWAVRDPIEKLCEDEIQVIDPGIEDKRLLVIESELASVLKVLKREGNTLSAIIRNSWDSGDLRTLTKNSPAVATGAHISIIGHITKAELLRYLDDTEAGNGFANRFLWICAQRSKCLPDGGNLNKSDLEPLIEKLKIAIVFAQSAGELKRDNEAKQIWHKVYPDLSKGKEGLVGSITARAEAQVMRIACIYALLDCSNLIRKEHLIAALAVWEYAESSVKYIFGNSIGDPVADNILRALKESSLSRTEISNLFGRNLKSSRLNQALNLLQNMNSIDCYIEETSGRSIEKWYIKDATN